MVNSGGKKGKVFLVGAGPGDVGLLTVKGKRLLERAEVVVYDYLANVKLLEWASAGAEKIYVGKQASAHTMTQEQINALLVNKGLEGKRVVRLKGGDPFVFGRGGEECEALASAGVEFEVVPGITAAIGGPAYAGIPVTHRDFNTSFTFVTGHEKEEEETGDSGQGTGERVDWAVIAKLPCVAFYMGVRSLSRICAKLVENGMEASMPAACIRWGTRPEQRVVTGTVSDLARRVEEAGLKPPALTIVGKVVSLREAMSWFEKRPLFGQTIVVTRTRQQASELSEKLEEMGANVLEAPTIEIARPDDWEKVDANLKRLSTYDWVIFTSANGVKASKERLMEIGLDARAFVNAKIAAIGRATKEAVERELALKVELCPKQFVAEALGDELIKTGDVRGKRFLLLRAEVARQVLIDQLKNAGAGEVADVAVYETKPAGALPEAVIKAIEEKQVNWITFTSSSTARNFARILGTGFREKLVGVKVASIGPVTSATVKELGLEVTVEAGQADIEGLAQAIAQRKA